MTEKDSKMDEKLAIPYKQADEDDRLPMEVNKEVSANENEEKVPEHKLFCHLICCTCLSSFLLEERKVG